MRSIFGRARDPDSASARIAFRHLVGGDGRQIGLLPGDVTAFEAFGRDVVVAEPGRRALAELLAPLADHHDGLAGVAARPVLDVAMGVADRAGNQPWIRVEVLVDADIDQDRRVGRAKQT